MEEEDEEEEREEMACLVLGRNWDTEIHRPNSSIDYLRNLRYDYADKART